MTRAADPIGFPPDRAEPVRLVAAALMGAAAVAIVAFVFDGLRGASPWVEIGASGIVALIAAFVLWRGTTRHRAGAQADDSAERDRAILESTIDAIVLLDPAGTIETANAAAAAMLGYRPGELARRDVSAVIHPLERAASFHESIGLIDGRLARAHLPDRKVIHRDGHEIPVDIALGVLRLADGDHVVASVRDISERKRAERLKDELISTVSHELRTPLTSVVGALGLLRSGAVGELPEAPARLIEIAENNSRRLIRLINDMLDIDRIQSGQLKLTRDRIDLCDVATRACVGSQGGAAAADIRLICQVPGTPVCVMGDADRVLQVITNLAANAVRACHAGGTVTIGVVGTRDGKALVTVDDEGAGVAPEFRDRIFGRFERAHGEHGGGAGLGLAISREIVLRHDGRIWFEDRPTGGARFAFTLDLVRENGAPAASVPIGEDAAVPAALRGRNSR